MTVKMAVVFIIIAFVVIFFISPILTFLGFIFKPIIWLCCWIFKLFKKAFKELSSAKKEQQNKKD